MAKCKFSQNSLCQVLVLRNTDTKVTCDGHHAACLPSRKLNLEDIRDRKPQKPPGWGGRRAGAGAPTFNLNRLIHGQQSKLLNKGIEKMAGCVVAVAVLLIIARLATQGEVPPQTKRAIQAAMKKEGKA